MCGVTAIISVLVGYIGVWCNGILCVLPSTAEKQIDLTNVDLKTLKVKELKKILRDWGEECRGCAEKMDFVNKIQLLMPTHSEL